MAVLIAGVFFAFFFLALVAVIIATSGMNHTDYDEPHDVHRNTSVRL